MKRSKNHHKLISGDKPHIFAVYDNFGPHWEVSTEPNLMWSMDHTKWLCESSTINKPAK